jgi:glycosyltransferase involved in cell wall biosynthesis
VAGLVVHEWLAKTGGSEKVVDEFLRVFPDADLQVLWSDDPERYGVRVRETWLARTPLRRHKAASVPFLPIVWRSISSRQELDWLLVSSHLFAHHVRLPRQPDIPKFVYVHTPARYIWAPELDTRGASLPARVVSAALKPIDRRRAREATSMIANSEFTRARIRDAWGVDAHVIYPPVDVERILSINDWRQTLSSLESRVLDGLPPDFILGASRYVPYKRLDAVIDAGSASSLPVVLAGGGPEEPALRAHAAEATVPVYFVENPTNALLIALYQRALAFVFPATEDFGIMPIEAMAAGTPVVVYHGGGAAESVRRTGGGVVIDSLSRESLKKGLDDALTIDRSRLAERTLQFSAARFRQEIRNWVEGRNDNATADGGADQ